MALIFIFFSIFLSIPVLHVTIKFFVTQEVLKLAS